jgi:LysM repeat protein
MEFLARSRLSNCLIGGLIMLMLFGCAGTREAISQKYAASKNWFKEKWQAADSKSSSSKGEHTAVEPEQISYFKHRVKWSGETLSLIARWYTGSYGNWKAIAQANPGLDPNRIAVGDTIKIPPQMMKTKKPLPRKVVCKALPGYFAHTVTRPNEKFSAIARWYTGNAENRKAIARVNPDIDPDFLLVGDEIYIPSSLLKTRRSMFARSNQISAAEPAEKPSTTETDTESPAAAKPKKIQLFGPKQ